jgi:hypothetical protein
LKGMTFMTSNPVRTSQLSPNQGSLARKPKSGSCRTGESRRDGTPRWA